MFALILYCATRMFKETKISGSFFVCPKSPISSKFVIFVQICNFRPINFVQNCKFYFSIQNAKLEISFVFRAKGISYAMVLII